MLYFSRNPRINLLWRLAVGGLRQNRNDIPGIELRRFEQDAVRFWSRSGGIPRRTWP